MTNLFQVEERHLAAVRWENIRAAYFTRIGKHDNATKCKLLAAHHRNCAKEAAAGRQPGKVSS